MNNKEIVFEMKTRVDGEDSLVGLLTFQNEIVKNKSFKFALHLLTIFA